MDIRQFNGPPKDTADLINGYMVYCPTEGAPCNIHMSSDNAIREAERLTKIYPSKRFYILQIKGYVEAEIKIKTVFTDPPIIIKDELGKSQQRGKCIDCKYCNVSSNSDDLYCEIFERPTEDDLTCDHFETMLYDVTEPSQPTPSEQTVKAATDSLTKEIDKLAVCMNCKYHEYNDAEEMTCCLNYERTSPDDTCNEFECESEDIFE